MIQHHALLGLNNTVRKLLLTGNIQPGSLPVEYPDPGVSNVSNDIKLNPISEWTVLADRVVATYSITAIDPNKYKDKMLASLASTRRALETGGIMLPNGAKIDTDRETQGQYRDTLKNFRLFPEITEVDWKGADGWITITKDDLLVMAAAVDKHVKVCFKAEHFVYNAIKACTTVTQVYNLKPIVMFNNKYEELMAL